MASLDRLFHPRSIAVVGASNDPYKAGYQMVYALRKFPGELYPINPKAQEIQGFPVYPDFRSIGKPVDLVILTIPAKDSVEALLEAGEAGAGAAMIISGGFAESGEPGKAVQEKILSVCRTYGIWLLGPNVAGFANPRAGVSANFTPWIGDLKPGGVGIVSQSGAMNLILSSVVYSQGLGISVATGIGNGPDVTAADVVDYLADDPNTRVIALALEGVRNGRQLFEAVSRAATKKPVLAFAVGRADIGEFAASHTGYLIGSYALKSTALKQAGAVVVDSSNDLIDAANLLSKVRLAPGANPGVGLLSGQAGPAMVIADELRSHSVSLPRLAPATVGKISGLIPPMTFIQNPVDTGRPSPTFRYVLQAMADDPAIDVLVVFAIHEPAVIDPISLFRETKGVIRQPVIFGTAGFPEHLAPTLKDLDALGMPSFVSPDRTARVVRALVEDARRAHRRRSLDAAPPIASVSAFSAAPDEAEIKAVLERIGIPTPRRTVCRTRDETREAFSRMAKPCVLKILSSSIVHKTEAGGVHLDIGTEKQLINALDRVDRIEAAGEKRYLLEEMAPEGLELIIGGTHDPSFGPTVLVGLGGTAAEALGDVAMRLAPIGPSEAFDMLSDLKGRALLDRWRGGPRYDKAAVADAVAKIGQLLVEHPEIKELDLNPVRVLEHGLLVLDAAMIVESGPRP
jgi:acyl-CoA synthetase (NDP forming)